MQHTQCSTVIKSAYLPRGVTLKFSATIKEEFRHQIVHVLAERRSATREELIGAVLTLLDLTLDELCRESKLKMNFSRTGEDHLDEFWVAA